MTVQVNCNSCGATAPETNTQYTLISTSFGWRLSRQVLPSGAVSLVWRCPTCWRQHKTVHERPKLNS